MGEIPARQWRRARVREAAADEGAGRGHGGQIKPEPRDFGPGVTEGDPGDHGRGCRADVARALRGGEEPASGAGRSAGEARGGPCGAGREAEAGRGAGRAKLDARREAMGCCAKQAGVERARSRVGREKRGVRLGWMAGLRVWAGLGVWAGVLGFWGSFSISCSFLFLTKHN